jgi:hypothetical protein
MKNLSRKSSTHDSLHSSTSTDSELSPQKVHPSGHLKRSSTSISSELSNARIIQSKLVYVINLPESSANESLLRGTTYFGQYGQIQKCVINKSPQHTAYQAYLTFASDESAAVCIKACNKFVLDGFELTVTYGTTKYCNYFLRGNQCPKPDCLYLHEFAQQNNVLPRDIMPHTKHIQPTNAVIDGLKVLTFPPIGDSRLPSAKIFRERAQSECFFDDKGFKSRFGFCADGEESDVPEVCKALRKYSSPKDDSIEIPISDYSGIKKELDEDRWMCDVLMVKLEHEKVVLCCRE